MATIPKIDRARIILDLIKDGEVANLADYSGVEKAIPALVLKYARASWNASGYAHPDISNPTNEQLVTNYINRLRDYHTNLLAAARVSPVVETARSTESARVRAEAKQDLNERES